MTHAEYTNLVVLSTNISIIYVFSMLFLLISNRKAINTFAIMFAFVYPIMWAGVLSFKYVAPYVSELLSKL